MLRFYFLPCKSSD